MKELFMVLKPNLVDSRTNTITLISSDKSLSMEVEIPQLGGGVLVSALDFRSEGRWFDAQSLPWCCFLRQETLPHIVSLHSSVLIGTG